MPFLEMPVSARRGGERGRGACGRVGVSWGQCAGGERRAGPTRAAPRTGVHLLEHLVDVGVEGLGALGLARLLGARGGGLGGLGGLLAGGCLGHGGGFAREAKVGRRGRRALGGAKFSRAGPKKRGCKRARRFLALQRECRRAAWQAQTHWALPRPCKGAARQAPWRAQKARARLHPRFRDRAARKFGARPKRCGRRGNSILS